MFGGRFGPKSKQLSPYERRAKARDDEYAKIGADTWEKQQLHEQRKALLGEDYRDRFSGSWRESERYMAKQQNQTFFDWLWN
jgi:hypothetical protein